MNKTKAFIYCRQLRAIEGESEPVLVQEAACREMAAKYGLEVAGVYQDDELGCLYPTGGEKIAQIDRMLNLWLQEHSLELKYRPGLASAIEAAKGGYLLVYEIFCLYRPLNDSYLFSYVNNALLSKDTILLSVKEGNFYAGRDKSAESGNEATQSQSSPQENKSKNAKDKIQDDGYYSSMPRMYGIRYIGGKEREIEVIPEQAEVIRFVYDSVLNHCKYTDLLKEMNTRFKDRHEGKCFYDSSWRHIIENPFYCGYMYDSQGALIKAKQIQGKEIVTLDEWKKANEIAQIKHDTGKVYRKRNLPFSGLMVCGHCGSKMSVVEDKGKTCYSCLQGVNVRHDVECSKSRVNINLVRPAANYTGLQESILPLLLLALYKYPEMHKELTKNRRLYEEQRYQYAKLCTEIKTLDEDYADGDVEKSAYDTTIKVLMLRATPMENRISELQEKIKEDGKWDLSKQDLKAIFDKIMNNQLDDQEFTELLPLAIKQIRCYEDYLDIETVYGNVRMRRFVDKQFRNFPKYTCRMIPKTDKQNPEDWQNSKIQVTYLYGDKQEEERIADFPNMEIYSKSK